MKLQCKLLYDLWDQGQQGNKQVRTGILKNGKKAEQQRKHKTTAELLVSVIAV